MELKGKTSLLQSQQALANLMKTGLDDPSNGSSLAQAANYSRFYFQRLFRQQSGETPVSCRKRLLLERAIYHLTHSELPVTQIAYEAGFESLEGFSRSFRKTTGRSPSQYRKSPSSGWFLSSPNNIHYDPVIGAALRLPLVGHDGGKMDLIDRLTNFDVWITRRILEAAQSLPDEKLDAPLVGYDNPLLYIDDRKTLRELLNRLVFTKETWMASIQGRPMSEHPDRSVAGMLHRMDTAFAEYVSLVKQVRDENLWETSFMDMLCDPPEAFTYGGMISHITSLSSYRITVVLDALKKAGIDGLGYGDPMEWKR